MPQHRGPPRAIRLAGCGQHGDGRGPVLCINNGGTAMPASTGLCATVTLTSMCQVERARVVGRPRHRPRSSFPTLSSHGAACQGPSNHPSPSMASQFVDVNVPPSSPPHQPEAAPTAARPLCLPPRGRVSALPCPALLCPALRILRPPPQQRDAAAFYAFGPGRGRIREAGLTATKCLSGGQPDWTGGARTACELLLCGNDAGHGEGDKGREKRNQDVR